MTTRLKLEKLVYKSEINCTYLQLLQTKKWLFKLRGKTTMVSGSFPPICIFSVGNW